MSRLLGFVRSDVDPNDSVNYWIWQAQGFPPHPNWDYERLQIQLLPAEDGNVLVRVLGPWTPQCLDGVFLHMHMNASHRPRAKTNEDLDPVLLASWNEALDRLQGIESVQGDRSPMIA